jgi:hypothetical protein
MSTVVNRQIQLIQADDGLTCINFESGDYSLRSVGDPSIRMVCLDDRFRACPYGYAPDVEIGREVKEAMELYSHGKVFSHYMFLHHERAQVFKPEVYIRVHLREPRLVDGANEFILFKNEYEISFASVLSHCISAESFLNVMRIFIEMVKVLNCDERTPDKVSRIYYHINSENPVYEGLKSIGFELKSCGEDGVSELFYDIYP